MSRVRVYRSLIGFGFPLAGVATIFGAVLYVYELRDQVALIAMGILMIEAGVWRLAKPFMPSERRFRALRAEVDAFRKAVQRLNSAAIELKKNETPETRTAYEQSIQELIGVAERITAVAGKTDEDLAAERRALLEEIALPGTMPE